MDTYIVDALRTPRALVKKDRDSGTHIGQLASAKPLHLVDYLLSALGERGFPLKQVESLHLGIVGQWSDQGSNLAQTILAYHGGLPKAYGLTVNGFCASSLAAIDMAMGKISRGDEDLVLAGGVESLSRVPMFSDQGPWFHDKAIAKQSKYLHMGHAADLLANLKKIHRPLLDQISLASHRHAAHAQSEGLFDPHIVPISASQASGDRVMITQDDGIRSNLNLEDLQKLDPRFPATPELLELLSSHHPSLDYHPIHTQAHAPALVDGASLIALASETALKEWNLKPLARVIGAAGHGSNPLTMLEGHIHASKKLLASHNMSFEEIDWFEVNESFAASLAHFQKSLDIPMEKINLWGGAIALGHPLGATGAILVGQLVHGLKALGLRYGLAAIPGGAGLGMSVLIEAV